jgi:hypothetical protein
MVSAKHHTSLEPVMATSHGIMELGRCRESGSRCQVEDPPKGFIAVRVLQKLKTGFQPTSARMLQMQMTRHSILQGQGAMTPEVRAPAGTQDTTQGTGKTAVRD